MFVAYVDGELAGFSAICPLPGKVKKQKKAHRTVVFPDYQGIGIGGFLINTIAEHFHSLGYRFTRVTSHPALIQVMKKSSKWIIKRQGRMTGKQKGKFASLNKQQSRQRITVSALYVGEQEDKS